jgi:hypothetical protein
MESVVVQQSPCNEHDCICDPEVHSCIKAGQVFAGVTSWPDHLPFGNQKRFWRDPVKRAGGQLNH